MTKNSMKKILLAIPSFTWHVDFRVHDAIEALIIPEWFELVKEVIDRKLIHVARNIAIKHAIIGKYDYLLFCDDDNAPKSDALKLLIEADKAIIGWIIRKRNGSNDLAIYEQVYDKANDFRDFKEYKDVPEGDDVFDVANIGTGFMLYKIEVLEKIYIAYDYMPFENKLCHFIPTITGEWVELDRFFDNPLIKLDPEWRLKVMRVPLSEDILFHYRARMGGFKLYAHKGVCLEHYGDNQTFIV